MQASVGRRLITGAVSGLVATGPMSVIMLALYRWYLRTGERYPLPPEQITARVARKAGARQVARLPRQRRALTWLAHFAYGAAMGGLYMFTARRVPVAWPARGVVFAMGVWAGSYMGWLPAARILPPATRQPARRNALMIISHLVWGEIIAFLTERMER